MYVIYLTQVLLPKKDLVVDVFFELCYKTPNELMVILRPGDLWQLHALFATHNSKRATEVGERNMAIQK
jgi:hypothetical protein